jgi:hypothetical protein
VKPLIFRLLTISILVLASKAADAQFLMDKLDTTRELRLGNRDNQPNYDHIRISGYIQPQYQIASAKGAKTFSGGDFAPNVDNRFMLRRGRIKFEYEKMDKAFRPQVQFVFQFDGTERGVFIRDFWGRVWEHKLNIFALTTGMMARPFGFEVNYSSGAREAPERGRMSQTLMKTERDLGVMVSAGRDKKNTFDSHFRIDAGIYNGQGVTAPGEYDSYKDLITQLVWKPTQVAKHLYAGGGISLLYGGIAQTTNTAYRMTEKNGKIDFVADSITTRAGDKLPRKYYGANVQLKYLTAWGATELRGEYWSGTQTAYQGTSETPGTQPTDNPGKFLPMYIRPFSGGFVVFLQNIVNTKHQVGVKYDWYDPNTKVAGKVLGQNNSFTQADIKYGTLGFGYIYYMSYNFKITFWYDRVWNEITSIPGYQKDVDDNVFTCRLQFTF